MDPFKGMEYYQYTKIVYLSDVLNAFKVQLAEEEEELSDYETDLNTIYEPFLKWQYLYRGIPDK
jgi:hypothetical protein